MKIFRLSICLSAFLCAPILWSMNQEAIRVSLVNLLYKTDAIAEQMKALLDYEIVNRGKSERIRQKRWNMIKGHKPYQLRVPEEIFKKVSQLSACLGKRSKMKRDDYLKMSQKEIVKATLQTSSDMNTVMPLLSFDIECHLSSQGCIKLKNVSQRIKETGSEIRQLLNAVINQYLKA